MPSIDAVEQFKTIVQSLAREPEIRAEKGLPPEDISPPESQLDDDLAGLLGNAPSEDVPSEAGDAETGPEASPEPPAGELDDLFGTPLPDPADDNLGPSLDDLLGPAPEAAEAEPAAADDPFAAEDPFAEAEPFEEAEPVAEPLDAFEEPVPDLGPDLGEDLSGDPGTDLGADLGTDLGDDLFGTPDESGVEAEALPDFGGGDAAGDFSFSSDPAPATGTDDLDFDEPMGDADFPELAGFADTSAEDVEAFDTTKEADEFGLGDFASQFGITADDHTDAELLNPAQAVKLDVEAAQKSLSLTEDQFAVIQRSLRLLPLNLRLAVEELLGEKEVVFEDYDKVVKQLIAQVPARTLAATVGKILGRKIIIPPGFEKGSGAELEALHGTLWYNLRTIMFPVLRIAALASAVAGVLVVLGWTFLLRPYKANNLYEQGLVAAKANDGAAADDLFAQAYYEWPVQDRFFQYAEAYQDTGDYDRARRKYLELLKPSVKAYKDEDKKTLDERYAKPLAPLPDGLNAAALKERLTAKKAALDSFYRYVTLILSSKNAGADLTEDLPGEVVLGNPDARGILDYSRFETEFGFDGLDREGQYRRADAVLKFLLMQSPGSKDGLLRKADNYLAWSRALSSAEELKNANSALSEYLRLYGFDSPVTWRFVKVFVLTDEEGELLRLRDRIDADQKMAMDGEVMAQLAKWLLDRQAARALEDRRQPVAQKTLEEEYGIRPKPVAAAEPDPAEAEAHGGSAAAPAAAAGHALPLAEGGGAAPEGEKPVELKPPYKYPYSSQPFRPDYLAKVDTLLLRSMETQKSLPELHYQLSRYYREVQAREDERRALAAADTYFQRLEPRRSRLNDRPAMRVATSNRIGEIFAAEAQPLQAEKYFLDAQRNFEAARAQGLAPFDAEAARVYLNLGNLYYRQTPGVSAQGSGTVPGGWQQALSLYETAEKAHLEDPLVTYRLGVIHYEKRDFALAIKRFFALDRPGDKGEASGRDNSNLLYAMANALFRSGNFASAEGYYREVLGLLREKRARITDFDPAGRSAHKALAQRLYETWNNLAAAQYRAANTFRSGTPEFKDALAALTTARAQAQILGRDLYEDKNELDITRVGADKLSVIRADEAQILAKTRKEKGLVEANLQVLSMIETATPARKEVLAQQLEIFARIPLELEQTEAP